MKVKIFLFCVFMFVASCCTTKTQSVPLTKAGKVFEVEVLINSAVKVPFMIDTGASENSIPSYIVYTLIQSGTIKKHHFLKGKIYTLADGSTIKCSRVLIDHIKVGNKVLYNLTFSISNTTNSPLLLGQNTLEKLKIVEFNYEKNEMSY